MVDNVTANPGSGGATFATDARALSGSNVEHWTIGKVGWGTRDSQYVIVDMANALPIQPGTGVVFATLDASDGPVAPGTAATNSSLSGAIYSASPPVLTGGQQAALQVNVNGALKVDASATTQPVSGTVSITGSLPAFASPPSVAQSGAWTVGITGTVPLPTGAATAANQPALNGDGGALAHVTNFPATQPISASALPLPTGAATSANQTSVIGTVAAGTAATNAVLTGGVYNTSPPSLTNGQQVAIQLNSAGAAKVDGSAVTQPVSGSVSITGTLPAFAAVPAVSQSGTWTVGVTGTIPLPTGAATSANQTSVIGTLAAGTSATNSLLTGAVYTAAGITLTNGQQAALQADATGSLNVHVQASVPEGTTADAAYAGSGNSTIIAALKGLYALLAGVLSVRPGAASTDGSTTVTTGGTAQNLFSSTIPTNGFCISNPDPTNDLWVSDSTTAAANGTGSIRVAANGGYYATEPGQKPIQAVSIIGAVTGQKITARRW